MLTVAEIRDSLRLKGKMRKPTKAFWELHRRWKRTLALAGVRVFRDFDRWFVDISELSEASLAQAIDQIQTEQNHLASSSTTGDLSRVLPPMIPSTAAEVENDTPAVVGLVVTTPDPPKTSTPAVSNLTGSPPVPPLPTAISCASKELVPDQVTVPGKNNPLPSGMPPLPPIPASDYRYTRLANGTYGVCGLGRPPRRGTQVWVQTKLGDVRKEKVIRILDIGRYSTGIGGKVEENHFDWVAKIAGQVAKPRYPKCSKCGEVAHPGSSCPDASVDTHWPGLNVVWT